MYLHFFLADETIIELEKELNKLQTQEDNALDKLSKANKSLERLKIEMGKLQDEISLHANNMQKISTEKKKLSRTLQQWRSVRDQSVTRSPAKRHPLKEHASPISHKSKHRKAVRDTVVSSDDNLPLAHTREKIIRLSREECNGRIVVKSTPIYDPVRTPNDRFCNNTTESEETASGYDTAPSSPNSLKTPSKSKKCNKSDTSGFSPNTDGSEKRSLRCRRTLRERGNRPKANYIH